MLRSGAVGALGSVADIVTLVALVELAALAYAPAAAAAAAVGALVVFTLNRRYAFRDRSPLRWRQLASFGAVAGGSCALNAGAVHLLAHALHGAYLTAKLVSSCVVFVLFTFPAQSRLVFAGATPHPAREHLSQPVPSPRSSS